MASPFSSAGGGNADTSPYSTARARGGSVKRCSTGGPVEKEAKEHSIGFVEGEAPSKHRGDRKNGGKTKNTKGLR
jgi:hypothetical protein